jgi:plasmid maintenance system antidote protein VapI
MAGGKIGGVKDQHRPKGTLEEHGSTQRRGITADTALRLARHFGTSADFWLNIQKSYELTLAQQKSLKVIERQVRRRTVAA